MENEQMLVIETHPAVFAIRPSSILAMEQFKGSRGSYSDSYTIRVTLTASLPHGSAVTLDMNWPRSDEGEALMRKAWGTLIGDVHTEGGW